MKAIWKGTVIAESDDTVVVEGNHYLPRAALRPDLIQPGTKTTICSWKGVAHYYTLAVDGQRNVDAVWYYPEPKTAASQINDRVAFWKGVQVTE